MKRGTPVAPVLVGPAVPFRSECESARRPRDAHFQAESCGSRHTRVRERGKFVKLEPAPGQFTLCHSISITALDGKRPHAPSHTQPVGHLAIDRSDRRWLA